MNKEEFLNQYKTKEWYETSKRIKARDHNTCQMCGRNDRPLSVHHRYYGKNGSLNVPDTALVTLCDQCHEIETYSKCIMNEHVKEIIDFCNENKLSMCFVDSLITWVFHVLEIAKMGELKNNPFAKEFLEQVLYWSSAFSDFVVMKKFGIDMGDFVEITYPEMIETYRKVKAEE